EKQYAGNIFEVVDVFSLDREILQSDNLADFQKNSNTRDKLYYMFVFNNGEALQTTGLLMWTNLYPEDIAFACTMIDPEHQYSHDLQEVEDLLLRKHMAFRLIEKNANLPQVQFRGFEVLYCWSIHDMNPQQSALMDKIPGLVQSSRSGDFVEYKIGDLPDNFVETAIDEIDEAEEYLEKFRLEKDSFFLDPRVIVNKKTQEIFFESFIQVGYELIRTLVEQVFLVKPAVKFITAYEPLVLTEECLYEDMDYVSFSMTELYAPYIPFFKTPWERFTREIDKHKKTADYKEDTGADGGSDESLDVFNAFLKKLTDSYNMGYDLNVEKVASKLGLSMEDVRPILQLMDKQSQRYAPPEEVSAIAAEYPLERVEKLPPVIRETMFDSLDGSELFTVAAADDENVSANIYNLFEQLGGQSAMKLIGDADFDEFLEDLFFDYFDQKIAYLIMNVFFYELLEYKGEWVTVRAYAASIYEQFYDTLASGYDSPEDFLSDFSKFVFRKICPAGLCEVKARPAKEQKIKGTYKIKTTLLFDKLIRFKTR
nr:hypothetical protein [Spirochaetales bacterium]